MRITISIDDETAKITETLLEQGNFPSMSALIRHAIQNMDQIKYEKVLLQEIRDLKQMISKNPNQDQEDEPPPRRRRKPYGYEDFEAFMDKHKDNEASPDVKELCRMHPDFLKRYQEANF